MTAKYVDSCSQDLNGSVSYSYHRDRDADGKKICGKEASNTPINPCCETEGGNFFDRKGKEADKPFGYQPLSFYFTGLSFRACSELFAEEFFHFPDHVLNVFGNVVGLDVRCADNLVILLVFSSGFYIGFATHVVGVRFTARHYQ